MYTFTTASGSKYEVRDGQISRDNSYTLDPDGDDRWHILQVISPPVLGRPAKFRIRSHTGSARTLITNVVDDTDRCCCDDPDAKSNPDRWSFCPIHPY